MINMMDLSRHNFTLKQIKEEVATLPWSQMLYSGMCLLLLFGVHWQYIKTLLKDSVLIWFWVSNAF